MCATDSGCYSNFLAGRFCLGYIRETADMDRRPKAVCPKRIAVRDLRHLREGLLRVRGSKLRLTKRQREELETRVKELGGHIEAGRTDRKALGSAQRTMILLFAIASRQKPE